MCLLDRWVCNSVRARMQFIWVGGLCSLHCPWQKHPFIIIQSKGGGGAAGHLTCYPNNMIKDGWVSSLTCMPLNLLSATVFFSPMHVYSLCFAIHESMHVFCVWLFSYVCMFPELKSWRWTAGPPGTGAHIICHITKGLRRKKKEKKSGLLAACVCLCGLCTPVCVYAWMMDWGQGGVAGLQCCCQDKQLRLCLGQVFHSDSAHWN